MIEQVTNHVWQSTLIAMLPAVLTLAFKKNRAEVRYWLWFSASLKFLVPFSLLMKLGSYISWAPVAKSVAAPAIAITMVGIAQPFSNGLPSASFTPAASVNWVPLLILAVWLCGFLGIALLRTRSWLDIRAAVRASTPLCIAAPVEARSTPGLLEPGVVGFFHPVLLLPKGIADRLQPLQLQAVLAHELCHIRRLDNLTSAIHMLVEAVFWFHPLVWWIGARLIQERERACDEAVLRLGTQPHDYAEGILNICKSYVESPLQCVSGVTGADLKQRIQAILIGKVPDGLNFAKKIALAFVCMAVLAVPLVIGAAQSLGMAAPEFVTASIRPCEAFRNRKVPESPGILASGCTTLQRFMQMAYGSNDNAQANPLSSVTITGGPAWTDSDLYEIDAKADRPEGQVMMNGPMLQRLLGERFKLKIHRETREIPVYQLTVANGGPNLQPFKGSCVPWNYDYPNPGAKQCAAITRSGSGFDMKGGAMPDLCYFLLVALGQPVIDQTRIKGRFDLHVELPAEAAEYLRHGPHGAPARTDLGASATSPALISAVRNAVKEFGLNLEPTESRGKFIVIDSAERPTEQ